MNRKWLSETVAKNCIYLTFVVVLVLSLLFMGSAKIISVSALNEPDTTLPSYDVTLLLRQIEMLETRLDDVEGNLSLTQAQNTQLLQTLGDIEDGFSIEYVGNFYATAYCCEVYPHICGGNGVTASGTVPTPGITVAADWGVLPAGTWIYIDGIGMRRVEDRGSAITGDRLDIAVDTHSNALSYSGQGWHDVWIVNWDVQA